MLGRRADKTRQQAQLGHSHLCTTKNIPRHTAATEVFLHFLNKHVPEWRRPAGVLGLKPFKNQGFESSPAITECRPLTSLNISPPWPHPCSPCFYLDLLLAWPLVSCFLIGSPICTHRSPHRLCILGSQSCPMFAHQVSEQWLEFLPLLFRRPVSLCRRHISFRDLNPLCCS